MALCLEPGWATRWFARRQRCHGLPGLGSWLPGRACDRRCSRRRWPPTSQNRKPTNSDRWARSRGVLTWPVRSR